MDIQESLFTCKRNGLQIKGLQFLPENFDSDKKYPTVIISHGFTGNYNGMAHYGRDFAAMGFTAYCFNFCGGGRFGEPDELKSEGKSTDMTIFTEAEDLTAVIEYAKGQAFVDGDRIILAGFSQGGLVSGIVAAQYKESLYKLILMYPGLSIPDNVKQGRIEGARYDPENVPNEIICQKTIIGRKYHEAIVNINPYEILPKYKGPVLLIHGLEDTTVPYTYSVRAKECYEEGQCKLYLVENMEHKMTEEQRQKAVELMREFLL